MKMRLTVQAAILVTLWFPGCHDGSSPTQLSTPALAGNYRLMTSESCGGGTTNVVLPMSQSGNRISFLLGVDTGGVQGTVNGNRVDMTWSQQSDAGFLCGSDLTGTATINGGTITGSVSGSRNTQSCFTCPSETIAFTLTRQ